MEWIIFGASFIFSFVIFLTGIHRNSFILCVTGSLLLLLFSIVTIGMGIQHTEAKKITFNITNLNGNNDSYTFDINSTGGLNDAYTFTFSLVLGIFSCFFLLYSLLYLRNKPPED